MSTVEGITLAIAVLGAMLGIINTWDSLSKSRVKLRVRALHVIPVGAWDKSDINFCIEVTNLSSFAVTVHDVGVLYHGTDARGSFVRPILLDDLPWPRRLEPRTSVTVYSEKPTASPKGHRPTHAYARTQCGVMKKGTRVPA